jgi:hypothetical protein
MNDEDADAHHLIPKQKGGKKGQTILIHRFCHTKIHSLFTNSELKNSYHNIDLLLSHPEIQKFVTWVQDKPSDFYMKNEMTKTQKRKRR